MSHLPPGLRDAIEEAAAGVPWPVLQGLAAEMGRSYRSRTEGPAVIDSDAAALAYAAYRMPGTHAAHLTALRRLQEGAPGLAPRRLLDVGGGSGAAAWAAASVFVSLTSVMVLDRSRPALDLGARLAATGPRVLREAQWVPYQSGQPLPPADLAVCGYLIGELAVPDREALVAALAAAAPTVVVVEPGTPDGYARILAVRRTLLEAGLTVAAPCPHDLACPLAGNDWCHFAARFDRPPLLRRLKQGAHSHEDEKFSYVAAHQNADGRPPARIIRHPVFRPRMVELELCRESGETSRLVVGKSGGDTYRRARKARWGDGWH